MTKVFLILSCLLFIVSLPDITLSQQDSIAKLLESNPFLIDSMNLRVKEIVISGNYITKNNIILREMSLKKGTKFTLKKYENDIVNINKLGLFTKVEILPFPLGKKELLMNVDVNERFYILPLPTLGIDDGEWAKFWVGLNVRWDNFRGRNETVQLYTRFFYNPGIRFSYFVPWIGDKLHLFAGISGEYSRTRNQSLAIVGKTSGGTTISANDSNYDNISYRGNLTIGKQLFQYFRVYSDIGYNYLNVNPYATGRTLSTTGTDKFLNLSIGIIYDSKNANDFATNGFYLRTSFTKYGFIDKAIDFGRYYFEGQSYIPVHFSKKYYITLASKLTGSLATGSVIPYYNHEYLGYSEDYVRGWKGVAYEGENLFSLFNEIRIPIIQPQLLEAKVIPIVRDMPIIKTMYLRYGLYATIFYDIGTVWEKKESIKKKQFLSGAGIGLNLLLPFDYIVRLDWGFRLIKPVVGQIVLSLSAKF